MMVDGIKLLSCTLALVLLPIALTLSSHLQPQAAGHHDPTQSPPPGAQELLGVSSEPAGGRGNTTRNSEESHLDRVSRSQEHQTGHQQRVLAYLRGHGRFSSDTGHNTQQAYPGALPPPALTEKLMQMLQECQFPVFDEFRQNLELCPWHSTCADIESRSCSRISECRGCLGLYTCNIPLAKCELKGVSRKTDGFIQNTLQHWMA